MATTKRLKKIGNKTNTNHTGTTPGGGQICIYGHPYRHEPKHEIKTHKKDKTHTKQPGGSIVRKRSIWQRPEHMPCVTSFPTAKQDGAKRFETEADYSLSQEVGAVRLLDAGLGGIPGGVVDDREVLPLGVADQPPVHHLIHPEREREREGGRERERYDGNKHKIEGKQHARGEIVHI